MTFPKISIITPSFNQGQFLEQTILSVISQEYPDLEYLVIDGGSTDHSVEIIKKYEKHITYWVSEKDSGQSEAINKGLKRSTGEIVNWLNSDDYYEPGALKQVAAHFSDPRYHVVSGKGRQFKGDTTIAYTKGVDLYPGNLAKTIGWLRMDQPETFIKKKIIEEIGFLDERLHYLMDRDWWLKYLLRYGLEGICQTNELLAHFRIHDESKSSTRRNDFETDHHSFFWSMAHEYNFPEFEAAIFDSGEIHADFHLHMHTGLSRSMLKRIFSYYFLLRGTMNYETNHKSKAEQFYKLVDPVDLENNDRRLFRKMKWRNKLPVSFVNALRKFTR